MDIDNQRRTLYSAHSFAKKERPPESHNACLEHDLFGQFALRDALQRIGLVEKSRLLLLLSLVVWILSIGNKKWACIWIMLPYSILRSTRQLKSRALLRWAIQGVDLLTIMIVSNNSSNNNNTQTNVNKLYYDFHRRRPSLSFPCCFFFQVDTAGFSIQSSELRLKTFPGRSPNFHQGLGFRVASQARQNLGCLHNGPCTDALLPPPRKSKPSRILLRI